MTTILPRPTTHEAIAAQPPSEQRALLERSPALVAVVSAEGRILLANRAWTDLLGHPSDVVVGRLVANFIHPEHAAAFGTLLRESCESGTSRSLDAPVRCRDGSHKWFYWQVRRDSDRGLFAIAFDVSERKADELRSERRAYVTSLRADIWSPFAAALLGKSIFESWAKILMKSLEAVEVGFWTVDDPEADPVLAAWSHSATAGQAVPVCELLIDEVRKARASKSPRAFVSTGEAAPGDLLETVIRGRGIVSIVIYPIIFQERVVAIVAGCLKHAVREIDTFTLETVAVEIGPALAFLRQHQLLAESKRMHDTLVRSAPIAVCSVDRLGNVTRWNPAAERLLGWPCAEIVGRPLAIAQGKDGELFRASVDGALAGQGTAHLETRVRSRNGQPVDVGVSVSPLAGADKAFEGALIVLEDVGERKRAARCLALEHGVTCALADPQFNEQSIGTLLSLIGTHLGSSCAEFWTTDGDVSAIRLAASWTSSASNALDFENQTRNWEPSEPADLAKFVLREGRPHWFAKISSDRAIDRAGLAQRCDLDAAVGIPIASGGITGCLLFFADQIAEPDEQLFACLTAIGEQVGSCLSRQRLQQSLSEATEKLRQAEKMESVGRLVGGVAHDFNNLLTVILGYGELLLGEAAGQPSLGESLTEIVESAKRASGLTRQLLAFCRKEIYNPVVLDLNAHVEGMEKMLRRLVGEAIELTTTLTADIGHVHADPAQIEQIVMNLVVNARDAMPTGGRITIETKMVKLARGQTTALRAAPGAYVLLSVHDTGCGMDEATRTRIFEPFFTTKGAGKGTGMGLATVQEIVQQCGGHIAVESEPGQGSTFQILLPPVTSGMTAWEVDAAPQAIPRGTETVVVVEDEVPVKRLMSRLLRIQGYHVHEAGNGTEALDILRKHGAKIDLLITDVVMPDVNGPALADRARALSPEVKVLFISGYRDGELRRLEIPDLGPNFMQKPFTTLDLAAKVRQSLDS